MGILFCLAVIHSVEIEFYQTLAALHLFGSHTLDKEFTGEHISGDGVYNYILNGDNTTLLKDHKVAHNVMRIVIHRVVPVVRFRLGGKWWEKEDTLSAR